MAGTRLGAVQNFSLTASSQASAKLGAQTRSVLITATSTGSFLNGAYIMFGDSTGLTVSSTNGTLFPAPWVDTFDVTAGQTFYTIEATTAHGSICITELS